MSYKGGRFGDNRSPSCVYVGNLPDDVKDRELEDLFYKFGRIRDIDIKKGRTTNGTAYAFVEFESVRDAEEAVERRDGCSFHNTRLRVEFTGERRPKRKDNFGGPPQRFVTSTTDFRVVVTNLPQGCRWQHLKDHMRKAGEVGFANVEMGRGVVEYVKHDDHRYALDKLDGSEMVGPFDSRSIIKVRHDDGSSRGYRGEYSGYRKRSRSRSRGRGEDSYKRDDRRRRSSRSGSPNSNGGARRSRSSDRSLRADAPKAFPAEHCNGNTQRSVNRSRSPSMQDFATEPNGTYGRRSSRSPSDEDMKNRRPRDHSFPSDAE